MSHRHDHDHTPRPENAEGKEQMLTGEDEREFFEEQTGTAIDAGLENLSKGS